MTKHLLMVGVAAMATGAMAKDATPPLQVTKCAASYGTIALTDGDSQGWTQFGLGSPRDLITAIIAESGCFQPHSAASGLPATFLMTAVAGANEEIDQTVNTAKGLAAEGLVRSGALGGMGGGAIRAMGMLGGLGGKKKTISAGLRVLSPANGMSVASGTGDAVSSSITMGGPGGWGWASAAAGGAAQYAGSKDGQMLTGAFVKAYNAVVAQSAALAAAPKPVAVVAAAPAPAAAVATVAVDTQLYAQPAKGKATRALRSGTTLTPTGRRDGLFIEAKDSFGTTGWVSVEDLR